MSVATLTAIERVLPCSVPVYLSPARSLRSSPLPHPTCRAFSPPVSPSSPGTKYTVAAFTLYAFRDGQNAALHLDGPLNDLSLELITAQDQETVLYALEGTFVKDNLHKRGPEGERPCSVERLRRGALRIIFPVGLSRLFPSLVRSVR